jgi:hypothetical protein
VLDGAHLVGQRDPALPLRTLGELAAEGQLEQRQLLLQRAALRGEHDARAQQRGAHTGIGGGPGGLLPLHADVGEERGAGCRGRLVEHLVAARPVPADGRTRQEHRRLAVDLRDGASQQAGGERAAGQQFALVLVGPAVVADAGTRQVDDRVGAVDDGRVERACGRVPQRFVRGEHTRATDETDD